MSESPERARSDDESVRLIRDSAAAVSAPGGSLARIRGLRFTRLGYDPAVLAKMGDMGWIGLSADPAKGGHGLGLTEYCALAEELGRGLVPEPLIPCALTAKLLTAISCSDLGAVIAGLRVESILWPLAANSPVTASEFRVETYYAHMAADAARFLLPVRNGERIVVHAVDPRTAILDVKPTQDGGTMSFLGLPALGEPLGDVSSGWFDQVVDEATLASAAYLLGVMEGAFSLTLSYLTARRQFGRLIGSFQVLQHRAVDLHLQIALTRASISSVAVDLDMNCSPQRRRTAVSRAKARASDAALLITRAAIQLHGAIGYTDEHDIGLFLRKAMVLAGLFGSAHAHRARYLEDLRSTPHG
jgi:alkylation response protein AidB-like acyl-CoA dehydrogenase